VGRARSISRWAVNKKGDTCVKPLAGNASEVTFSELLGTGVYKAGPDQMVVFRGGKLDAKTPSPANAGCPPTAPVMRAEVQPAPAPKEEAPKPAETRGRRQQ